jgi:hypothetical protein
MACFVAPAAVAVVTTVVQRVVKNKEGVNARAQHTRVLGNGREGSVGSTPSVGWSHPACLRAHWHERWSRAAILTAMQTPGKSAPCSMRS